MGMTAVIILNLVFVVLETDSRTHASPPAWSTPVAYSFLGVFVVELSIRIFVHRLSYFKSKLNIMDFCIISVDLGSQVVNDVWGNQPRLSVLNALRICRLLRIIRALSAFR